VAATETEGPYPLRAILANTAIVRADMTEGKTGVPLTLRIKLVDVNNSCAAIANAWVYIWHCDKDGLYSGYDATNNAGQADYTYLRGIQKSDSSGFVTFKTIYPGWYEGRITHIHCMVFLAGSTLSSTSSSMATTQFAFPLTTTTAVYASSAYTHGQNTSVTSFASDNVFSDGTSTEMLTVSGSVKAGYVAGIVIGVDQTVSNGSGSSGGGGGTAPPSPPGGGTPPASSPTN
jgi:protocatechuate 3,4-dioxygenase beta subunit